MAGVTDEKGQEDQEKEKGGREDRRVAFGSIPSFGFLLELATTSLFFLFLFNKLKYLENSFEMLFTDFL